MTKEFSRLLAALLILVVCRPIFAESRSALHVSAYVIARAILTVDSQPNSIRVTSADVARGFVEVPAALRYRVRSNDQQGYMLQFEGVGYPFVRARVSFGTSEVVVGGTEASIAQPPSVASSAISANVRLEIDPSSAPGVYDWPVRMTANPL